MTMNRYHRKLCSSQNWAAHVEKELIPSALGDTELGDNALEVGPGYGANLRVLVDRVPRLTALEIDENLHAELAAKYGSRANIVHGDGTAMPLADNEFSAVVCFTMLHHVPTARLQDSLFAEAFRVLRPGGVFAGGDGVHRFAFWLIHLGDTYNPVPPKTFADRLSKAGFDQVRVALNDKGTQQRFHAVKPA